MLRISHTKEPFLLLIGDIVALCVSLWLMLAIRYGSVPTGKVFMEHLVPFSMLFVIWLLVFFIAGLYEKHTILRRTKLPSIIFNVQAANCIIAVLFFYFIPFFTITPKTNLFIFLGIFSVITLIWRIYGYSAIVTKTKQRALIVGTGAEMASLLHEINGNTRYDISFVHSIDIAGMHKPAIQKAIMNAVTDYGIEVIVIDLANEHIESLRPALFRLILNNIRFVDLEKLYEDIFDRIPLALLRHTWFFENIRTSPRSVYRLMKRGMDIVVGIVVGLCSLIVYPFVAIALKIQDRGPVFITQERIGKNNKIIRMYKFRSMTMNDNGQYVNGQKSAENRVTRIGAILRKTRIDELPQLWNVIRGDVSLIGPRPELPQLVAQYEKEVPYYDVRHLITPGLSGWAQIYHQQHPHHGVDTEETRNKLSYDLYYVKNRSVILDLKIALRTIQILLSQKGL